MIPLTQIYPGRRHSSRLPFHHFALVLLRLIDAKFGLETHGMSPADKIGFLFDNLEPKTKQLLIITVSLLGSAKSVTVVCCCVY